VIGWGTANHLVLAALIGAWGLVVSLAMDRLTRPSGATLRRPVPAMAIHAGLFLGAWCLLWLLGGRPGFAAALTLSGQFLVIAVSNAKFRALREPFLFSDFGLFSQVFRFPRLYLPFFGVARAVGVAIGTGVAVAVGLLLEGPWPGGRALAAALLPCGPLLLMTGTRLSAPPRLDPLQDLRSIGLFPSLWLYWLAELRTVPLVPPRPWLDQPLGRSATDRPPDLVLVQSESFFDVRRLYPGVRPELLSRFDALRRQALMHGLLLVSAWGANTIRTEFAVLSGIGDDALGVHRFNPYRRFARRDMLTLPHRLRALGYETVCIHPYPMGFFGRDRIFPNLGFDRFIDIDDFPNAPRDGPYVADAAVTRKIAEVLGAADGPTFVFAITMENHGPLHLERVSPAEMAGLYLEPPQAGWDDLAVYLRHIANADRMFGDLAELVAERPRGGVLCLYGDHVPSMPRVYEDRGYCDPRTDYVVWPAVSAPRGRVDLDAYQLPEVLLAALAGVGQPATDTDQR
jgi:hypothetical protein